MLCGRNIDVDIDVESAGAVCVAPITTNNIVAMEFAQTKITLFLKPKICITLFCSMVCGVHQHGNGHGFSFLAAASLAL